MTSVEALTSQIPYPNNFRRQHLLSAISEKYCNDDSQMLDEKNVFVSVAGRVMQRRIMGKVGFIDLQDMSGRLQIYLKINDIKSSNVAFTDLSIGDILGVEGIVFRTKTQELSIKAQKLFLLTKAVKAIPGKGNFYGVKDIEFRYRQRYVDLIVNPKVKETFVLRTRLLKAIRQFLDERDYLEVETPMMHAIAGGALARPFVTYHNTLNMPLYLRVAPELYLKRLVVGGFEKVYEINRNFRNEGLSTRHNPEFTMLEFYEAYADYEMLMRFMQSLLQYIVESVLKQSSINYQGEVYDFSRPFKRFSVKEALLHYHSGLTVEIIEDFNQLSAWGGTYLNTSQYTTLGALQFALFEETVEKQLRQPTFITKHPIEVSPLARRNDQDPNIADRFELYIGGRELANGFSELNDPKDQAERFKLQATSKAENNLEAMDYDHDYIKALEYGLPPTAGAGIGIDRLIMLLADATSIRDVILFPLLRPNETTDIS